GGYSSPVLDHIMMQLGDLSSRIETGLPADGLDPARWVDPVLARLEEIGSRMDAHRASAGEADDSRLRTIEEQISAIAYHIEQAEPQHLQAAQPVSDERLAALEEGLGAIVSRLQTFSGDGVDFSPIAERLESIEQMFAGVREAAMDAASQAAERAMQHAGGEPAGGGEMMALLTQRLEGIEEQLALSRDMAMDAAAQAAERAFQMAGQMQPPAATPAPGADAQAVEQLSRELHALEAQARDLASRNDDSFEGIRQALLTISQRLEGIEDEIRRATTEPEAFEAPPLAPAEQDLQTAAVARRMAPQELPRELAPPLAGPALWEEQDPGIETDVPQVNPVGHEAEFDDIPLEPGSGVPDLAALVRDASKRRKAGAEGDGESSSGAQDFLAAARRAAQAAVAQEANARAEGPDITDKSTSRRFKLPSFLQNRRKLLMGASAAVIIAAAAIPVLSRFGGGEPAMPQAELQVQPEQQAAPAGEPAQETQTAQASAAPAEPSQAEAGGQPAVRPVDPEEIASMQGVQTAPEQTPAAEMDSGAEIPALPDGIVNDALRQAAEAGDPLALFEVARRYTDGDGIEASLETAAQWYEAAARAGSAPAQYRLANFLEKGHGVKMDVEKSALWYQRAAEQGNALAMHNLAVIYTSGLIGGKPDMESAIGWFQKAADLGVKDSQVNLGIIYAKGIGIEADAVQAYKWLAIAARGGDTDAAGKRDTLAAAMRPEQLEKARGAADLWKAQPLDPEANVAEPKPEWKSGSGESAMLPGSALDATAAAVNREMIAKVQAKLAQKGYDPGPADGQMGARTIDAVKAFQKEAGLPADGQITTELLKKLDPQA
ncbi:MAG: peptidoglycan-binding protein, partial [Nitratireductor sp.]|nr:peptidoglycan-binding protein [Nitratireductor sp.]